MSRQSRATVTRDTSYLMNQLFSQRVSSSADATGGMLVGPKLKCSYSSKVIWKIPHHLQRSQSPPISALHVFYRTSAALHPLTSCQVLIKNHLRQKSTRYRIANAPPSKLRSPRGLPSKHTSYRGFSACEISSSHSPRQKDCTMTSSLL